MPNLIHWHLQLLAPPTNTNSSSSVLITAPTINTSNAQYPSSVPAIGFSTNIVNNVSTDPVLRTAPTTLVPLPSKNGNATTSTTISAINSSNTQSRTNSLNTQYDSLTSTTAPTNTKSPLLVLTTAPTMDTLNAESPSLVPTTVFSTSE
jgi:hypothetical protein